MISIRILLKMRNASHESCRHNSKRALICSVTLFPKIVQFVRYVEKYCTVRQATDDNAVQCMHFLWHATNAADTRL